MAENIVLDPSEVATSRTAFDITPWVASAGPDWGDGVITAYMAQAQRGDVPVDYRVPNRTIAIPLSLRNVGGTTFSTARNLAQAKAAMFQQEGGWLKRVTSGGTAVFADVINASLHLGGGWGQAFKDYDIDATLTLECIPDFYEAEIDLGDNTTTSSHIIFTETGIRGNYPARTRIVVDDDQPVSRLGLIWAVRSRRYSSSAANGIYYPASELTAVDTSIGTDWTSLFSTDRDSGTAPTGALIHQGTHRIWIGVTTTSAVDFRLVWDVGDMTLPEENAPVACDWSSAGGTFMLDLGEVRLDAPPVGTHRWKGLIQAKAATAGATVTLREMWVVPVDEGYGVLRASLSGDIGMAAYSARSSFTTEAGAVTGDSADTGGAWVGAGDAVDFTGGGSAASRSEVSDAANTGRYLTLNVNLTDTVAQIDSTSSVAVAAPKRGVIARYIDTSNWFKAELYYASAGLHTIDIKKRVAATVTTLGTVSVTGLPETDQLVTLRAMVLTSGVWVVWVGRQGSVLQRVAAGQDAVLATGGALATGDPGFYDEQTSATACLRTYDSFASWVPPVDAVVYSGQSLELQTAGMFREDSTGAAYGPVASVVGDLPRLPPATIEARTCEIFVNASRGDFDEIPDATRTDDISVRAFYRPSWLTVPG